MGVGFYNPQLDTACSNPPYRTMVAGGHRFIRGNHDNPRVCKRHTQYIPDGTIEGASMFIGGAFSTDRARRTEGYDWWSDEELSIVELNSILDNYVAAAPLVVVTHTCPEIVARRICGRSGRPYSSVSRTDQAFQAMFELHQPEYWVFGHHHYSFREVIDGTRFICLNELEYVDL